MATKTELSVVIDRAMKRLLKCNIMLQQQTLEYVNSLRVSEHKQGNFYVVALVTKSSPAAIISLGVAKRMPTDASDDAIGYNIALVRAVDAFIKTRIIS